MPLRSRNGVIEVGVDVAVVQLGGFAERARLPKSLQPGQHSKRVINPWLGR
jgi:hypothetical protein